MRAIYFKSMHIQARFDNRPGNRFHNNLSMQNCLFSHGSLLYCCMPVITAILWGHGEKLLLPHLAFDPLKIQGKRWRIFNSTIQHRGLNSTIAGEKGCCSNFSWRKKWCSNLTRSPYGRIRVHLTFVHHACMHKNIVLCMDAGRPKRN